MEVMQDASDINWLGKDVALRSDFIFLLEGTPLDPVLPSICDLPTLSH